MKTFKQYILGLGSIAIFAFYALMTQQSSYQATGNTTGATTALMTNNSLAATALAANAIAANSGQYKNGMYVGSVQNALYGNLQVEAVISGGKLTDVQFLQYPQDNGNSKNVSTYSLPVLRQEAIAAQSANVNAVSGATQVSQAFDQSLSSALSQAANA